MSDPTDREVEDLLDELRHEVDANPYATLAQRALLAIYYLHRDRQLSAARIAALESEVVDLKRQLAAGAPRWKVGDRVVKPGLLPYVRGQVRFVPVPRVFVLWDSGIDREEIAENLEREPSPAPPAEGKGEDKP